MKRHRTNLQEPITPIPKLLSYPRSNLIIDHLEPLPVESHDDLSAVLERDGGRFDDGVEESRGDRVVGHGEEFGDGEGDETVASERRSEKKARNVSGSRVETT